MNGIIPLYKDTGMTSADCVYKLRKILHEKKIGHTGTLDPQVDGVLPVCVGQATKLVNRLTGSSKEYIGEITLGYSTTTEDSEGDVVEKQNVASNSLSKNEIDQVLHNLTGDIQQIPPMFSAVKVNGKKLYEYARNGEEVERPVRNVKILAFERTSDIHFENDVAKFNFRVECSKGTYIRTLSVEVGEQLGLPAHMSKLTRTRSAGITLDETISISDIEKMIEADDYSFLTSIEDVLTDIPNYELDDSEWSQVENGVFLPIDSNKRELSLMYKGKVKAIYEKIENGKFKPQLMLLRNE